ncbi:MAG: M48 family metallopeptidase [Tepidisphaeraceae bacterium]|jgi:STE24 endopeptidase
MSRFLPLVIFVIWLSSPPLPPADGIGPGVGCAIFLGFYVGVIAVLAVWSRHVARWAHLSHVQRRLRRFNAVIYASRIMIPLWLAAGVFALGWKELISNGLDRTPVGRLGLDCPGLLVGCLPSFLAWMGLWWAQFPADRALREQNILIQLNENLPLQPPPSFRAYFFVNLRLQLLFTIAPALLLLFLHDGLSLILPPIFHRIPLLANRQDMGEALITLPALGVFLVFSPEILRRVLQTEPMPDCALRRRLVEIARRHGVGIRRVLLWKTQNQMGNAAVMGFVSRFRYVLLSDLLLETMHDEQIEAIFAHEIGHVTHRHLPWLMAAMATMMLVMAGPGQMLAGALGAPHGGRVWLAESVQMALMLGAAIGLFALVFGFVSRKFERQADVFAARTIQGELGPQLQQAAGDAGTEGDAILNIKDRVPFSSAVLAEAEYAAVDHVGRHGAAVFCSALERVAAVNNIPIAARSWCHGSIAKRIRFLEFLSRDSRRTADFDRFMYRLYLTLVISLLAFGAWTMLTAKDWMN